MQAELILADPPWQYYNKPPNRTNERFYDTMDLESIKRLPIGQIAAERAVLFMWAVWPMLPEALEVIDAWGFTFKTLAWEWTKTIKDGSKLAMGMGYYTRANCEPCLLAFKGKPQTAYNRSIINVLRSPRTKHSQKPFEQYGLIHSLYPTLTPRVELFARKKQTGWLSWGNEVDNDFEVVDDYETGLSAAIERFGEIK